MGHSLRWQPVPRQTDGERHHRTILGPGALADRLRAPSCRKQMTVERSSCRTLIGWRRKKAGSTVLALAESVQTRVSDVM